MPVRRLASLVSGSRRQPRLHALDDLVEVAAVLDVGRVERLARRSFRAFVDDKLIYRKRGLYRAEPLIYFESLNRRGYLSILAENDQM